MRQYKYAPLVVMLSLIPQVQANDLESTMGKSPVPYAYLKVPFGGASHTNDETTFGFAVSQSAGANHGNLFNSRRPPLLNLEYKGDELESVRLNGLNIVDKHISYDANGIQKTNYDIQWEYVVGAVVGIGVLWAVCEDQNWNLCGGDHKKKRYSAPA